MKRVITFLLIVTNLMLLFAFASHPNESIWGKPYIQNVSLKYPIIFVHGIAGSLKDWEQTINKISPNSHFTMFYHTDNQMYHNYYGDVHEQSVRAISMECI